MLLIIEMSALLWDSRLEGRTRLHPGLIFLLILCTLLMHMHSFRCKPNSPAKYIALVKGILNPFLRRLNLFPTWFWMNSFYFYSLEGVIFVTASCWGFVRRYCVSYVGFSSREFVRCMWSMGRDHCKVLAPESRSESRSWEVCELLSLLQALQAGGLSKRQRPESREPTCVNPFTPEGLRVEYQQLRAEEKEQALPNLTFGSSTGCGMPMY